MRTWVLTATTALVFLMALVWVTAPEEDAVFEIHGVRKNHAFFHSNDDKTFEFEIVMNSDRTFHGYEEAMVSHRIVGKDAESSALALDFKQSSRQVLEDNGVRVRLVYALPFTAKKEHVHIDPAYLEINYADGSTATVPIGTFSYRFHDGARTSPHLDFDKITVLSEPSVLGASAIGACLTFKALSEKPVTINGIDPGTPALNGNMDYLTRHEEHVTPFTSIEEIIGTPFNPKAPSLDPITMTIGAEKAKSLCVPFQRQNTLPSESFPFNVTYETGAEAHTLVIDDFKYIRNTNHEPFKAEEASRAILEKN